MFWNDFPSPKINAVFHLLLASIIPQLFDNKCLRWRRHVFWVITTFKMICTQHLAFSAKPLGDCATVKWKKINSAKTIESFSYYSEKMSHLCKWEANTEQINLPQSKISGLLSQFSHVTHTLSFLSKSFFTSSIHSLFWFSFLFPNFVVCIPIWHLC